MQAPSENLAIATTVQVGVASLVVVIVLLLASRRVLFAPFSPASTRGLYETSAVAITGGVTLSMFVLRGSSGLFGGPGALAFIVLSFVVFAPLVLRQFRLTWERHILTCAGYFVINDLLWNSALYLRGEPNWMFWILLTLVVSLLLLPRAVPELANVE